MVNGSRHSQGVVEIQCLLYHSLGEGWSVELDIARFRYHPCAKDQPIVFALKQEYWGSPTTLAGLMKVYPRHQASVFVRN